MSVTCHDNHPLSEPTPGTVVHFRIDATICTAWLVVEPMKETVLGRKAARIVEVQGEKRIARIYNDSVRLFHGGNA